MGRPVERDAEEHACVPVALKMQRRWVTWRFVQEGSEFKKKPHMRTNRPSDWLSFDGVLERSAKGGCDGIGFVLGDG